MIFQVPSESVLRPRCHFVAISNFGTPASCMCIAPVSISLEKKEKIEAEEGTDKDK